MSYYTGFIIQTAAGTRAAWDGWEYRVAILLLCCCVSVYLSLLTVVERYALSLVAL